MKKIIVPIDFSSHSEYALKTSVTLAKKHNLEILLLHMLELESGIISGNTTNIKETTLFHIRLAEKNFKEFLNKEYLNGVKITAIIKHFKVFSEINKIAKEQNADLIVMGSHGSSGYKEVFMGSNTEKVVRSSEIPVLIIKNSQENLNFESVVFALDFSEKSIDAYKKAMKILSILADKIHLVHINTPLSDFKSSDEIRTKAINFLEKSEGNISKLNTINYVADYSIEQGIFNFSNVVGGNLISAITNGRTGISHYFTRSISEDIANHASIPVITFKM
ncbi:MAG: universal stress protein [Flavobacteriaceae bacterium]|nr:universal stress protein [Flavobacteriaceae bacterium]